jgi:hypothetical protein
MANMNMDDASKQEKIRRGPHAYVTGEGRHGTYVERPYLHQEYPKVMDKTPAPQLKDFKGKPDADLLFENARKEWDDLQTASIVTSKAEEEAWIARHGRDPVVSIEDRQYPKTMDKTLAPVPKDFDTLEDFRAAKADWKAAVTASIVHDKDEEELWLREHEMAVPEKKAKGKRTAA